jgi:hypothetical protein
MAVRNFAATVMQRYYRTVRVARVVMEDGVNRTEYCQRVVQKIEKDRQEGRFGGYICMTRKWLHDVEPEPYNN